MLASARYAAVALIPKTEAGVPTKPAISIVDDDASVREGAMDLIKATGFLAEASIDPPPKHILP
jgi:hypothetical protein